MKNMKNVKNDIKVLVAFLMMLIIGTGTVGLAQDNHKWGGIPSPVDKPPLGTTIDKNLSVYYNTPVATGEGKAYWFIGGWGWFNQSEMANLPSASLQYGMSPYDCASYNGCGSNKVNVPISFVVIVLFVAFVAYLVRRKK